VDGNPRNSFACCVSRSTWCCLGMGAMVVIAVGGDGGCVGGGAVRLLMVEEDGGTWTSSTLMLLLSIIIVVIFLSFLLFCDRKECKREFNQATARTILLANTHKLGVLLPLTCSSSTEPPLACSVHRSFFCHDSSTLGCPPLQHWVVPMKNG
jgi:uncharacterized membrane protein